MHGVGAFFGFTSGQDDKNSTMVIAQAYQGGLGMPDRDYYTEGRRRVEEAARTICRACDQNVDAPRRPERRARPTNAKTVMDLETSLAKPARTRVELRDPQKNYNKMTQAELQKLMPDLSGRTTSKRSIWQRRAISMSASLISSKPPTTCSKTRSLDDWKTYLRWHLINDTAPELSSDFVNENFNFFGNTLHGHEGNQAALETRGRHDR